MSAARSSAQSLWNSFSGNRYADERHDEDKMADLMAKSLGPGYSVKPSKSPGSVTFDISSPSGAYVTNADTSRKESITQIVANVKKFGPAAEARHAARKAKSASDVKNTSAPTSKAAEKASKTARKKNHGLKSKTVYHILGGKGRQYSKDGVTLYSQYGKTQTWDD